MDFSSSSDEELQGDMQVLLEEGMDFKKRHRKPSYKLNEGTKCGVPEEVSTISSVGQRIF